MQYYLYNNILSNLHSCMFFYFGKKGILGIAHENCVAWQKTAEFVANYFKKGQQMAMEGRIQVSVYDGNDGQKRWKTEIIAEQIEFVGSKSNGSNDNKAGSNGGANTGSGSGYSDSQLGYGEDVLFDDDDLPF